MDEESEYVFTCGCNIIHAFNKTNRERCTKKCYEKKLRKSVEKDCVAQCKGWFPGAFNKDRRACKKICRETGGLENMSRDDVLDEIIGNGEIDPEYRLEDSTTQAGVGNVNMIIGIVIGLIVLIGAIIMLKK